MICKHPDGSSYVIWVCGDKLPGITDEIFAVELANHFWKPWATAQSLGISKNTAHTWARRLFPERYLDAARD